ncbi:MAG TPA: hypothetical protein EYN67_08785 [Flavobacteriales bacterium]|nr:hypothetical protein [Flavobacteriales bacterium]
MVQSNIVTKVAFIGSTILTLKCLKAVLAMSNHEIIIIFGLDKKQRTQKVNAVDLQPICDLHQIELVETNDWQQFRDTCYASQIEKIICMGDSRLVPDFITTEFDVIGNHGALLPLVHGGASLVWGRLLELGHWGISIMQLDAEIDSGDILSTRNFSYEEGITQSDFVKKCDDLTVDALQEVLDGKNAPSENSRWSVRVRKHTDSAAATKILKYCYQNKINVYMPSRTLDDSEINPSWDHDFTERFKRANDSPYPKAYDRTKE